MGGLKAALLIMLILTGIAYAIPVLLYLGVITAVITGLVAIAEWLVRLSGGGSESTSDDTAS